MSTQPDWMQRNLILFVGKGGVGKTTLAESTAQVLADKGKRTLLIRVLHIEEKEQKLLEVSKNLHEITLNSTDCFREYIAIKLKVKKIATFFLGQHLIQYFEKAAPGVREMVLLGKIWYEREHYDHVVVDMPSTGYALTMIHTPFNFLQLFPGGPISHDSLAMTETMNDPSKCAIVAVALPEEMPIQESIELYDELKKLLPKNETQLVVNRVLHVSPDAERILKFLKSQEDVAKNTLTRALEHSYDRSLEQKEQLESVSKNSPWKNWLALPEIEQTTHVDVVKSCIEKLEGRA